MHIANRYMLICSDVWKKRLILPWINLNCGGADDTNNGGTEINDDPFDTISAYLLILATTFSEEAITSGMPLNEEEKKASNLASLQHKIIL